MKKHFLKAVASFMLASAIVTTSVGSHALNMTTAFAVEADASGFVIEDGVLTEYKGTDTNITIPDTVTAIGERAFYGCTSLTSVTLPSGLKRIGKWAFYGCTALTNISLPDGVESIEALAFYNCSALQSITIPKSVINIEDSAISQNALNNLIIYGEEDSLAETYANVNQIVFEIIGESDADGNNENIMAPDSGNQVTGKSVIKSVKQSSLYSLNVTYAQYNKATYYKIMYSTKKNFTKSNTKSVWSKRLSCELAGLKAGVKYYIKVQAYKKKNSGALGKASAVKSKKVASTFKPAVSISQVAEGTLKVKIDKVATATKYQVVYATNSGFTKNKITQSIASNTYNIYNLPLGNTYYVKVKAYNGSKAVSGYSNVVSKMVDSMSQNKIKSITQVTDTQLELVFNKISNAKQYKISYSTVASTGKTIKNPIELIVADDGKERATQSVIINGVAKATKYYFTVNAYRNKKEFGKSCKIVSIQTAETPNKILFSKNKFSFQNLGITQSFSIDGPYYQALMMQVGSREGQKKSLEDYCAPKSKKGVGNCFGMSCIFSLTKIGRLSPSFFKTSWATLYDMEMPVVENWDNVNNCLLNYYHLGFIFGKTGDIYYSRNAGYYSLDEIENNKIIAERIFSSDMPSVLLFEIKAGGSHAVVVYNYYKGTDGYNYFEIWDPNETERTLLLRISENGSDKMFKIKDADTFDECSAYDWDGLDGKGTQLWCVYPVEYANETFDEVNIQDFMSYRKGSYVFTNTLMKLSTIKKKSVESSAEDYTSIGLNYDSFTVKRSDGVYAKFENGDKTEGTLDVGRLIYFNEPNTQIDARLNVPKLEEGQNYTIIPETTAVEKYQTEILCSGDTGYYAKLNASDIVEMTVSYIGDVQTKTVSGEKVEQRIVAGSNDESKMPWLSTKINGTDSGFSLIYDKGKVQISSDNQVDVNILVSETYQRLEMGTVSTDSGSVSLSNEEESYVVKDATGAELVKKEMGHFVFFRTGVVDIEVSGYTNVATNSCVAAPENVTREGYELEGWYTTSTYDEGTKWDFTTNTVTADIYLYAKWTEKKSETVVKDEKPKKVGNVSVKNSAKKTAKITWKKVSKATGYQVQYSTNKKFKKTATQMLNVKSNSKKITKLKKGKTYYVRVRAYVKSGNKTTYGTYSTVKKIKIKK